MRPIYLFGQRGTTWSRILSALYTRGAIALFLDYDGTLVPIRKKPSLAVLPKHIEQLLRRLSNHRRVSVTLVTGRSLASIKKVVSVNGLTIVANHGFQISYNKKSWIHPRAIAARPVLQEVYSNLENGLRSIPNVVVEDKQQTLTIHYRNVHSRRSTTLRRITKEVVAPHQGVVKVTAGKKVLEVRPDIEWGKGHGVRQVLKSFKGKPKPLVIYIGDDKTDEDAFGLLQENAITIRVGRGRNTLARYYVRTPREVQKALEEIETVSNR